MANFFSTSYSACYFLTDEHIYIHSKKKKQSKSKSKKEYRQFASIFINFNLYIIFSKDNVSVMPIICKVAFPFLSPRIWHYLIPEYLGNVECFSAVIAPFGKQLAVGIAIEMDVNQSSKYYKKIWEHAALPLNYQSADWNFYKWISNYYMASYPSILRQAFGPLSQFFKICLQPKPLSPEVLQGLPQQTQSLWHLCNKYKKISWKTFQQHQRAVTLLNYFESLFRVGGVTAFSTLSQLLPQQLYGRYVGSEKDLKKKIDMLSRAPQQRLFLQAYQHLIQDKRQAESLHLPWVTKHQLVGNASTQRVWHILWKKEVWETKYDAAQLLKNLQPTLQVTPYVHNASDEYELVDNIFKIWKKKNILLLQGGKYEQQQKLLVEIVQNLLNDPLAHGQIVWIVPHKKRLLELAAHLRKGWQLTKDAPVELYHNKLSASSKLAICEALNRGRIKLLLTTAIAPFLPYHQLTYCIMEEPSASSYQHTRQSPIAHTKSLCLRLAKVGTVKMLLAAISPTLESYANAKNNIYGHVLLTARPQLHQLKFATLLGKKSPLRGYWSPALWEQVNQHVEKDHHILFLISRKAIASYVHCSKCDWYAKCLRCQVSLSYELQPFPRLVCRHCSYKEEVPIHCLRCQADSVNYRGIGVAQWMDQLRLFFPQIPQFMWSRRFLALPAGKASFFVATAQQLQPHILPKISCAIVVDFDNWVRPPSLRGYEQVWHRLNYLAQSSATLLLQSRYPLSNKLARLAKNCKINDYKDSYALLLEERKILCYPPYCRLLEIIVAAKKAPLLTQPLIKLKKELDNHSSVLASLGPYPIISATFPYAQAFLLKLPLQATQLADTKAWLHTYVSNFPGVVISFRVDPE